MKTNIQIINCHTHIFNRDVVPDKFLPSILQPVAKLLESNNTANGIGKFLKF